jgi:hypothetical protein
VYAYNPDGTSAGLSFQAPNGVSSTLAWDGEYFLTNAIMDAKPVIYRVDKNGQVVDQYATDLVNMTITQVAFVKEHYAGQLWFTNNSGIIGQLRLEEEGTASLVQSFPAPSNPSFALAHDHYDLWYGKFGGTLYRIDDGLDEINWIRIDPETGIVPVTGSFDVSMRFNASEFEVGDYYANMIVLTNDPQSADIRIPIDLQVTDYVSLGPDTSFCGHLSITLDAGEGFAGYQWSDGSTGRTNTIDSTLYGIGEANIWVDAYDIGGEAIRDSIRINFLDCASIFEFSGGVKVSIFPNPSHGIFEILAENLQDDLLITVADMGGKVIREQVMHASRGKVSSTQVDLTGNLTGSYILRLSTGGKIKVERVIVYPR